MDDDSETDALVRQARRLETACSIIQAVHSSLSLETMVTAVVENLVEVGGFQGATLSLEGELDSLVFRHFAQAGDMGHHPALTHRVPLFVRGVEIGMLAAYCSSIESVDEQAEQLDLVHPTLLLGLDHACSYAEVLNYRRTLEIRVEERTAQLAAANEQLVQAKAARDRFFANINHEIRTPLTQIMLAVDSITRSGGELVPVVMQRLEDVRSSTRRLLHLVNSLLQLAAGDEGKLRIRPGPLDVARVLERLVRGWEAAAENGNIVIEYIGPSECAATMDEAAVETIAGNFLSNAVKFTPQGGRITVELSPTDETVTIRVRDTGPGIDPEFVPKLFGRFERSATAVDRGIRGTGIGLSLSKELVDLQRGTVEVIRHEQPTGTSFVVTLPRHQAITAMARQEEYRPVIENAEPTRRASAPAKQQAQVTQPDATILLAEDDPVLAEHMIAVLSENYRVLAAPNGKIALELARKHLPDMLVTDLDMPEMNGIELTRHFLALHGTALSPALIVSAHAGLGERLAGFEAGAVDYVVKPFSADELLARVRSQLAVRKLAVRLYESEKLAALGVMSAGLAHELRNPTNAIVNALQPLWELLPDELRAPDTAISELYEVTLAAATQLRDVCKDVLEFARPGELRYAEESFPELVETALRILRKPLEESTVQKRIDVRRTVRCAGPQIQQILVNLIENAAHAAGAGGWIRIEAHEQGERVILDVSDSGPGVKPELRERIFEPFFTTKDPGKGTGLGLSTSRRIAQQHGGMLAVIEQAGGSVFRLELPLSPELS